MDYKNPILKYSPCTDNAPDLEGTLWDLKEWPLPSKSIMNVQVLKCLTLQENLQLKQRFKR